MTESEMNLIVDKLVARLRLIGVIGNISKKEEIGTPLSDEAIAEKIQKPNKKNWVSRVRREMFRFPEYKKYLRDNGRLTTLEGFNKYLEYRGSTEWRKEGKKNGLTIL